MPWALALAWECRPDTTWGQIAFERYPHGGAPVEQDARLLAAMRAAFRAWLVWVYMPQNKIELQPADREFMAVVLNGYE